MSYARVKRLLDIGAAAAGLIVLAPLMGGIAIAVRLTDPGPALFRARRLGAGGRTFEMLKFRTMQVNAPDVRNADGSTYSGADDPRITRLGRWLRRTSLDELPQFWNVLRGDMSLVGPRPDLPDQIQHYQGIDHLRLRVRPGLTGLAQISGRNNLSWKDRRALDVQYVSSMSLRQDLRILRRTIPALAGSRGVFAQPDEHQASDHAPPEG